MIGYVTLGTDDMAKSTAFYDALLGSLGAKRVMDTERFVLYSAGGPRPGIALARPYDGKPATAGNGSMVALVVDSTEKVDAIYKQALELGGKDEGAAGPRSPTFYAGYFRDLEGNKLAVFCVTKKP